MVIINDNPLPTSVLVSFLAPKTLREKFGGLNTMKDFLGVDAPPVLERLISAESKHQQSELPTDF